MRPTIFLFVLAAAASGCKSVDCGPGTIERGGTCAPADETTGSAACGDGTMLDGDRCVPVYAPTTCDPTTTAAMQDPDNPGVTICYGIGGGGCGTPLSCPTPAPGKQTICGQLYDITDNSKFQGPSPTGAKCDGTAPSGPCALSVQAFDALMYGMDPSMAIPLTVGSTYIDDCGRFKLTDVSQPTSPYVGLGFDDASPSNMGPNGVTNTTGVAVNAQSGAVTDDVEAWVAPKATTDMWAVNGPSVSAGIYVGIFRTHKCDQNGTCTGDRFANQSGVTMTKFGFTVPNNDYYFMAAETGHTMIDPNATATGSNGTGLETGASVNDGLKYSATGGISDTTNCTWEAHAAASLANIVFFQVYRPQNQVGHQCAQ